jgi:hypothetical protein
MSDKWQLPDLCSVLNTAPELLNFHLYYVQENDLQGVDDIVAIMAYSQ